MQGACSSCGRRRIWTSGTSLHCKRGADSWDGVTMTYLMEEAGVWDEEHASWESIAAQLRVVT